MGKRTSKRHSKKDEQDEEVEEEPTSIFQRLFSPGSADTSVSSDSNEDDSKSDEHTSTMSEDYTEFSDDGSSVDSNKSGELESFNRDLRARHRAACRYMTSGKYAKSIKTFEGILADILDKFGEEHHRVGAALHNVAVANLRAGNLSDALDAIEEAIRLRKLTLGEEHPKVADSLVEYGIILLSMKKYNDSLSIFKKAFRLRQKEARKTEQKQEAQLKMAKIKHNIGCVNFELGKLEEAKKAYQDAIDQQQAAFGTWKTPFMIMTDTTKPGFLTMASTMCNKGYIDLEQNNFLEAIQVFNDSLKIQKVLLSADNKLILSTLDNIGYAYCMIDEYEKANKVYEELVKLQQESYGELAQKGWAQAVKKQVFCQIRLYQFEKAFDNLRALEEYLSTKAPKTKSTQEDLQTAHMLLGEVNYQIFKFPTLAEYTSRAFNCGVCADDRDAVDPSDWFPPKPTNGSKMSGHRMTYA